MASLPFYSIAHMRTQKLIFSPIYLFSRQIVLRLYLVFVVTKAELSLKTVEINLPVTIRSRWKEDRLSITRCLEITLGRLSLSLVK